VAVVSHYYADPENRIKLRALAGLGVNLTVAVPDSWRARDGSVQRTQSEEDGGVRIVPIAARGPIAEPDKLRWSSKAMRKLFTDFRPELVHLEDEPWSQPAALGIRLARKVGARTVVSTTEALSRSYTIRQRFRRERTLRQAAGIIATSQLALTLATKRHPTAPRLVLPLFGVTPPPAAARDPHPGLSIGFIGRLVPERGLDLLFRACVGLAGKWTITVIGTGPSQEELEELAQRLGIAARISWLGALPKTIVDQTWPTLDCVVLPSRTTPRWVATVGQAALHAMAHGVAVIASASGVLPELVGDAGRIVPEEDVPALAAELAELYSNRYECERLGAAGRHRVLEHFSDDAIAARTLTFWRTLTTATA
jgi:glycosyltransferase involved in cell wall biosynthesis